MRRAWGAGDRKKPVRRADNAHQRSLNQLINKPLLPTTTVVICTCKRPLLLARCLASVVRLAYPSFSIVVVDNAPGDESVRSIALRHGAQYHAAPVRGVSRARNVGARACGSDIVAYLDDDMVPHRDWLARIAAEFAGDASVVAVAGPVLPMECGALDDAALAAEVRERPWGGLRFQVDRASREWFERANFGGIGDANMALRRAVFADWPGFEESIGRGMPVSGGEEHYAFFTLIERGHRVAYAPAAMVFHPDKAVTRELKLHSITAASAYAAFVAVRHPRHVGRIAKFFVEAALGRKRRWRAGGRGTMLAGIPRLRACAAALAGLHLYWRARQGPAEPIRETQEAHAIART